MDVIDALPPRIRTKIDVDPDTGCWEWNASRLKGGYGRIQMGRKVGVKLAHRVVFELLRQEAGEMDLDHLCRNRGCVNPDHLEPVTRSENLRRGVGSNLARARYANHLWCPQGHPLFGDNLYLYIKKDGGRNKMCRTCRRENQRKRAAAKAA